jgi:hypothetical protein
MAEPSLAAVVRRRVRSAAHSLGATDPLPYVGGLIDRSFSLPQGDQKYAMNALTPGSAPFEPSYSEREPQVLRFTISPLGPEPSPVARRDEATRELRRLVGPSFGSDALRWFDRCSEEWRGLSSMAKLDYGAWFGSSFDGDGLQASKVYYELQRSQLDALPPKLATIVSRALDALPTLVPVFTSISCRRNHGHQRVTFFHRGALQLRQLEPLMAQLGLSRRLPGLMQVVALALGGRFELPERSVLIGLSEAPDGAELKLEVMLGMIPDLPPSFLNLLALGLSERPRELRGLQRWLEAFTPDESSWPGEFSVLSVQVSPTTAARVSLYLRPVEFELPDHSEQRVDVPPTSSFAPAY